jgi:carboxypeptidase family protein/TonB-dependent receptor-like protein
MFTDLRIRPVRIVFLLALLLISLLGQQTLRAQTTTGTILGTVNDSTGGVIPGATIQIRNTGTGVVNTTTTDGQGRFNVPDLQVGSYEVRATHMGFQTEVRQGITLSVGGQAVVDLALQVGETTQTVTVQGEATQVETTSSEVSSLITPTQMSQLPLNGRNFEQLITLSQGVQIVNTGNHNAFYGMSNEFSVAGARPEGALELLDDSVLNTYWNHGTGAASLGTAMGVEAISEFNTLVNTYGAQFGGNGAVINATTKSGTNDLHGSVYEYLRNSALDARNWSDPLQIPVFQRNQFGGSLGGPIKKDKLFFFANYEGLRQTLGEARTATVPDAAARQGYLPGTGGTLTPVNSSAVGTGSCTATYSSSSNCVTNSLVQAVLNTYPNPVGGIDIGKGEYQLTEVANQQGQEDYGVARIDYHISDKDSLLGRYIIDNAFRFEPFNPQATAIPLWPENDYTRNQYLTVEETHVFSPQLINVARFGWSNPNAYGSAASLTTPALNFFPDREGGQLSVGGGISTIGVDNLHLPYNFPVHIYTAADDISWTHGAHDFRFGVEINRAIYDDSAPFYLGGSYSFNNLTTLIQGNPRTYQVTPPGVFNAYRDIQETEIYPYIQDQWRISRRLTLNLGLRYEFVTNPTCNSCAQVINHLTATPTPPGQGGNYGFVPLANVFHTNPSKGNFAPRIGFALDPFNDHKTAIRGGVGVFYDEVLPRTYENSFWQAPPNYSISFGATQGVTFPTANSTITNDLNNGTLPAQSLNSGGSYDISRTPLVVEYNLNVQHEFWDHTVLLVGYVGSAGENLISGLDQNPITYFINSAGQEQFATLNSKGNVVANPRANPNQLYGSQSEPMPVGYSRYNSLQVSMTHPMAHDVQMAVNYTYSQCLDDGSITFNQESNGTGQVVSNPWNLGFDRGPCAFDIRHHISVNSLINLPFHANHLNRILGGWQLAPILLYATGSPFSVSDGFNWTSLSANDRANIIPGCNPMAGAGTRAEWYNPNCFALQPVGTLGDLGRNTLNLPPSLNVDFGLLKDIPIKEMYKLEFRAEFFNIFNIQNWGTPDVSAFSGNCTSATQVGCINFNTTTGTGGILSGTAGQITTFQNGLLAREIQFALKFLF